jgi:hypothetical protein
MGKKSISRTEAEAKEGLDTVKNDIPDNRMQNDQQVQNSDAALETRPASTGFEMKKDHLKGSKLKQEAIAEVISGGSDSGMGISAGGRNVSGTAGGILTANNSTPIADKVRSRTRFGKKMDRLATKMNYTPSEQVLIEFDESKPLADSSNEDQGYNGSYRNEYARSQKKSGAVPGDLMFQRSVDLIMKDQIYHSQGQIVLTAKNDTTQCAYTPSKTYAGNNQYKNYKIRVGGYLPRKGHFKIDPNGKVRYVYFDIDDVTAVESDADMANKSSAFRLIHSNKAELDRIAMDAKAGDEKADIWTPLARAVNEPTKTSYLLSAIEAQTGNYCYLAYSKASTNFSYQLNRAVKDGQDIVTPAVEEAIGLTREYSESTGYTSYRSSLQACFNLTDYLSGAASLIIPLYDSPNKYNNKADWLLQPRGPRMHLQTADNNINTFRVDSNFVNVFAGQEVFSTIDHEYDPLLPICMTDKAALIDRVNLNELGAFTAGKYYLTYSYSNIETAGGEDDSVYDDETLVPALFTKDTVYVYQKVTGTNNPGIVKLASGKLGHPKDGTNITGTCEILFSYSGTAPTGYTAVKDSNNNAVSYTNTDIVFRRLKVRDGGLNHDRITAYAFDVDYDNRLYVYQAGPYAYAYSDLRNIYSVTVKHPLVEGLVQYFEQSIGGKLHSILGNHELVIPWVFSTQYASLAAYLICAATPWIQQVRQNSMKDVIYYEDNVHEYPFSGLIPIKDAPFHNFVNFGFNGYDEPLETKVMQPTLAIRWVMPEFFWHVDDTYRDYVAPFYFNQAEFDPVNGVADPQNAAMSMPSIRSGVRLGCLDTFYGMSEKDIRLCLDRYTTSLLNNSKITTKGVYKYGLTTDGQVFIRFGANDPFTIGELLSAPRELGLIAEVPGYVLTPNGTSGTAAASANGMGTSYRIKIWTSKSANTAATNILSADAVDIDRAANYVQKWFQLDANTGNANTEILGLVFGLNDEGSAQFTPFIGLDDSTAIANAPTVVSHQRSLWTRLQMLPFALSPFDAEPTANSINRDIYDLLYVFGLAGFRASDYRESVYNRSKEVVNQGLLFVTDPWVNASPILTHGASSTGVSNVTGFKLSK